MLASYHTYVYPPIEPEVLAVADPLQVQPALTGTAVTVGCVIGKHPLLNCAIYAALAALFGAPGV